MLGGIIKEKDERIAGLERERRDCVDKQEVMQSEIADLSKQLGVNQGIIGRPENDALIEKNIEEIKRRPSIYDDPPEGKPEHKRHKRGSGGHS